MPCSFYSNEGNKCDCAGSPISQKGLDHGVSHLAAIPTKKRCNSKCYARIGDVSRMALSQAEGLLFIEVSRAVTSPTFWPGSSPEIDVVPSGCGRHVPAVPLCHPQKPRHPRGCCAPLIIFTALLQLFYGTFMTAGGIRWYPLECLMARPSPFRPRPPEGGAHITGLRSTGIDTPSTSRAAMLT